MRFTGPHQLSLDVQSEDVLPKAGDFSYLDELMASYKILSCHGMKEWFLIKTSAGNTTYCSGFIQFHEPVLDHLVYSPEYHKCSILSLNPCYSGLPTGLSLSPCGIYLTSLGRLQVAADVGPQVSRHREPISKLCARFVGLAAQTQTL